MTEYDHTNCVRFDRQWRLSPSYSTRTMWHHALQGGHAATSAGWGIAKKRGAGLLLQYILRGSGWIKVQNRRFEAKAGHLIFLNCHLEYEMITNAKDPWEHYWIVFDSGVAHLWAEALQSQTHPVFTPLHRSRLETQFRHTLRLAKLKPPGFEELISESIYHIVVSLFVERAQRDKNKVSTSKLGNLLDSQDVLPPIVMKALQCISGNYYRITSIQQILQIIHISSPYLHHLFKKHLGTSPMACVIQFRIHHAQELLQHTNLPIKEISVEIGIQDTNYFSILFRKKTGKSPKQYRLENTRFTRNLHITERYPRVS